jgi:hypothetical protein
MKAPQPPNPYQTAAAQQAVNNQTAQQNQAMNMVNQTGPYGNLTYTQTGTRTIPAVYKTNKKGKQVLVTPAQEVPIYTANTTLSPQQQALLDQQSAYDSKMNDFALGQVDRLKGVLDQPLDLSNTAVSDYISNLARQRLDPIWNQKREEMDARLRNQGLQPGTEAYDKAMLGFQQGQNDAYNQMLLQARGQGINEMLQSRNQPINEISALMNGGQMQLPNWVNTPNTSVSGVDLASLINSNYQTQAAGNQAFWGGLAGLGGSGLQGLGMAYGGWK